MAATYVNRSPFAVSVKNRRDLYREFPFNREADARTYASTLEREGLRPRVAQRESAIQLRYRETGYPDFVATFDSYAEAQAAAEVIRAQRLQRIYVDHSAALRWTTADLIRRYLDEECRRHKGGTEEAYRLRALLRHAGVGEPGDAEATQASARRRPRGRPIARLEWLRKPLAAVTPADIEDFVQQRLEQVAPATVDRELDLLAQVFSVADKTWRIRTAEPPMRGVRRPRYFNERTRRLAPDEEARLLAAAAECDSPYVEVAIRLALETAMRRGELLGFAWDAVDLERRCIQLDDTKNGRPRKVPLTSAALAILLQLPRGQGPVVAISENALKLAWVRLCERAGVIDLTFHDLRHEAISRFAERGTFTLLDLQAISGHRDIRMLQRYAHLCTQKLAERMDQGAAPAREYVHRGRRRRVRTQAAQQVGSAGEAAGAVPLEGRQHEPQSATKPSNVIPFAPRNRVA